MGVENSRARAAASIIVIAVAVVAAVLITGAHPAEACLVSTTPQPAPGFEMAPNCKWYAPDGTPYDRVFHGTPWDKLYREGVGMPWNVFVSAAVALVFCPLLPRAPLAMILRAASGPLRYFVPGAELRR